MAHELDGDTAAELARSLKVVEGFPWDADAVKAMAEALMRWCKGAFVNNVMWPPEAQARWLVTFTIDNWKKWLGTAELRQVFRAKFEPQPKPASNAVVDLSNQPCWCGSGLKFQSCCKDKPWPEDELEALRKVALRPQRVAVPSDPKTLEVIGKEIEKLQAEKKRGVQ